MANRCGPEPGSSSLSGLAVKGAGRGWCGRAPSKNKALPKDLGLQAAERDSLLGIHITRGLCKLCIKVSNTSPCENGIWVHRAHLWAHVSPFRTLWGPWMAWPFSWTDFHDDFRGCNCNIWLYLVGNSMAPNPQGVWRLLPQKNRLSLKEHRNRNPHFSTALRIALDTPQARHWPVASRVHWRQDPTGALFHHGQTTVRRFRPRSSTVQDSVGFEQEYYGGVHHIYLESQSTSASVIINFFLGDFGGSRTLALQSCEIRGTNRWLLFKTQTQLTNFNVTCIFADQLGWLWVVDFRCCISRSIPVP